MSVLKKSLILITLVLLYLLTINSIIFFSKSTDATNESATQEIAGVYEVKLKVSSSVTVTAEKNKWYGTIVEVAGKNYKYSNLYLFNAFKMPLETAQFNFIPFHLGFLVFLAFVLLVFAYFSVLKAVGVES